MVSDLDEEVLSDTKALHLRAEVEVTDESGRKRRPGEEWLVTNAECESLIPEVGIVSKVSHIYFLQIFSPHCK